MNATLPARLALVTGMFLALSPFAPGTASAHTESDVIAAPAGATTTVTLKPTHGCGNSPTVGVAIQAPVKGATAGPVAGWTATATDDGNGNTVLEWKDGSLPANQTGGFPVTFTAPNTVGQLLTFPSIQYCQNGEELAWISGDPEADFPAPRLLILTPDSKPVAELEDVPADAAGRSQLVETVDVDNPAAPSTTTTAATTTTTAVTATTGVQTTPSNSPEPAPTTPSDTTATETSDDDSNTMPVILVALIVVAIGGVVATLAVRRRSQS